MIKQTSLVDSVHIRIHNELISDQKMKKLKNKIEITHTSGYPLQERLTQSGNYKNFNISINPKTVCLNGSVPKFRNDNNIENLTHDELIETLQQLAFELNIPLLRGDLARVDIAMCVPLDNILRYYILGLLDTPNYDRFRDGYGVRYRKNNLLLTFYDKDNDVIKNPEAYAKYKDQHLMRIELRVMSSVRKTLMKESKKLKAVQLFSRAFQNKLTEFWWKHYSAILKKREIVHFGKIEGWKDCQQYLMAMALHDVTMSNWFDQIEIFALENDWSTEMKSDVRKASRKVWENNKVTILNPYIKELEEKIEQVRR